MTLDDDVAAQLSQIQQARNTSFKETVNAALREGLAHMMKPPERRSAYHTRLWNTGKCALPNVDNVAEVIAWAGGENYR